MHIKKIDSLKGLNKECICRNCVHNYSCCVESDYTTHQRPVDRYVCNKTNFVIQTSVWFLGNGEYVSTEISKELCDMYMDDNSTSSKPFDQYQLF